MLKIRHSLAPIAALLCILALPACNVEITTESVSSSSANPDAKTTSTAPSKSTRVMTYNIQYLSAESASHGDRIAKLREIIADIKPDVVAVQEVEDRAAMELVFPPAEWTIFIDDDSADNQDVAFAVRKPLKITNAPHDLDADDEHFLATGDAVESYFPLRRDALFAKIETPNGKPAFTAVNIHAKARVGGRANTDHRRIGASRELLSRFKNRLAGQPIVLLGDFNDSPDDTSMNILETGNSNAKPGPNPWPSDYMVNLLQPLWEEGQVTNGASARRLDRNTGLINNIYPDARSRNNRLRNRDAGTGPILFDQILVSRALAPDESPQSAIIYTKPIALTGPGFSRPSDHLPVYADVPIP